MRQRGETQTGRPFRRVGLLVAGPIAAALLTVGAWAAAAGSKQQSETSIRLPGTLEASDAILVSRRGQDWKNPSAAITELVPEGARVEKGDVVFRVDATEAERRLADQEATVKAQRLEVTSAESEVATLEAELEASRQSAPLGLAAARVKVDRLRHMPDATELAEAEAEVERLRATLDEAKSRLEDVAVLARQKMTSEQSLVAARFERDITATELSRAEALLELVEAGAESRKIQIAEIEEEIAGINQELAVAEGQVELARAKVDLQDARAGLAYHEGRLARRREDLELLTRHAPVGGKVVYCEVRVGYREYEKVAEGTEVDLADAVVSIISGERFHLRARADEHLIGRIQPGQPARVRLDALQDTPLAGTVERFDASLKGRREVVDEALVDLESPRPKEFDVIISLQEVPKELMPGLSGTAELQCEARSHPEAGHLSGAPPEGGPTPAPLCFPGYVAPMDRRALFTPSNVMGYITGMAPAHTHREKGDVILELTGEMARANLKEHEHLPEPARERVRMARLAAENEQRRCRLQTRRADLQLRAARLEVEYLESLPNPAELRMARSDVERRRLQLRQAERLLELAREAELDSEHELEQKELAVELARLQLKQEQCRRALHKGAAPEDLAAARCRLRGARVEARAVRKRAQQARKLHERLIAVQEIELKNLLGKIARLEGRLERRIMRAPISGEIVYGPHRYHRHRTMQEGDFVPQWPMALGYICDLGKLQFCAVVDHPYVSRFSPGQPVQVRLRAFGDRLFEGRVSGVVPLMRDREQVRTSRGREPDRYSRVRSTLVKIALELPEQGRSRVLPGMTGTAILYAEGEDGA